MHRTTVSYRPPSKTLSSVSAPHSCTFPPSSPPSTPSVMPFSALSAPFSSVNRTYPYRGDGDLCLGCLPPSMCLPYGHVAMRTQFVHVYTVHIHVIFRATKFRKNLIKMRSNLILQFRRASTFYLCTFKFSHVLNFIYLLQKFVRTRIRYSTA